MNGKERAKLLRGRFKKLFPVAATPLPVAKEKRVARPKPEAWRSSVLGIALHEPERRKKWLAVGNAEPDIAPRPERRRKGETALTRISRQLPRKLPAVTFPQ
jgi:hypothetical protein